MTEASAPDPADESGDRSDDRTDPLTDAAVSAVNRRFYRALESADLDLMSTVWSHRDDVSCAHPGRVPLIGWPAVERSWRAIFAAGGNPQVIVTEERVIRRGPMAWITIAENMLSDGHTGAATALNLFEHDGRRWRMLAHHAAPVLSIR